MGNLSHKYEIPNSGFLIHKYKIPIHEYGIYI